MILQNITIMCLNETWLNDSITDCELFLQGFTFFRLDRQTKKGGGVLILISMQYLSFLESDFMKPELELLHVSTHLHGKKAKPMQIICLYRPPNTNINLFLMN